MRVAKPTVDKNGKHTTVYINPERNIANVLGRVGRVVSPKKSNIQPITQPGTPDYLHDIYTDEQVKAYFPAASSANIIRANAENGRDHSLIIFRSAKFRVEGSGANVDNRNDTKAAASSLAHTIDEEVLHGRDKKGYYFTIVTTEELPAVPTDKDIRQAYTFAEFDLKYYKNNLRQMSNSARVELSVDR